MAEMRLIDANALPRKEVQIKTRSMLDGRRNIYPKVDIVTAYSIDNAPTIDAVPVVHASWVKAHGMMPPEYHHRKQCSLCGGWALQDYFGRERMSHYCPNCGAKMDGGDPDGVAGTSGP